MYNHALETFKAVADCGSFSKASERLYISSTAVMKQMNALETQLSVSLFTRTPSGVQLTAAGECIYRGAVRMMEESKQIIAAAQAAAHNCDTTLCIGTSMLNPAKPFMDLWYHINQSFPGYKLHLVPFEDNHTGILHEIEALGEKFDFLIGVCDSKAWLALCRFLPLGRYKKMVAVSREHRLAEQKRIRLEDLHGETLMMVARGDSGVNDFIRHDLELKHPQIHIEDTPQFYDLSVFNRCAESNRVLLTIECWQDVHPGLVSIPVDWDYSIPYGLLYSHNAPQDVQQVAQALAEAAQKQASGEV